MEYTINKLSGKCQHWDKIFEQYNINNYQYVDQFRVLHESPMQFVDATGTVHGTPLHYLAKFGTAYINLEYQSQVVQADDTHKC